MDGTLLDNEHKISQENTDLITYAQKNNIVLVEDEDGFEIPISITDIAVVSSDDYSTAKTLKSIAQDEKAMSEEKPQDASFEKVESKAAESAEQKAKEKEQA